jgi:hypothetical protein
MAIEKAMEFESDDRSASVAEWIKLLPLTIPTQGQTTVTPTVIPEVIPEVIPAITPEKSPKLTIEILGLGVAILAMIFGGFQGVTQ